MSTHDDDKLLQIREIIFGNELKNVKENQDSRSSELKSQISGLSDKFSKEMLKVGSRIDDEKLLLINSIDFLKNEIQSLEKNLSLEKAKNLELIEEVRKKSVSREQLSKVLKDLAVFVASEEEPFFEVKNPENIKPI